MRFLRCITRHPKKTALAVLSVVAAGEVGFIALQGHLHDEFMRRLLHAGAASHGLIITAEPRERSFFSARDRIRVTLASSVLFRDPSRPPLSFDFDVVSSFGPLGLSGDIYPLNETAATARLLMNLKGRHPKLAMQYRFRLFAREWQCRLRAAPFDVRLHAVRTGVGPISWHARSDRTTTLRARVKMDERRVRVIGDFPDLSLSLIDPARNIVGFDVKEGQFRHQFGFRDAGPAGGLWTLTASKGSAERFTARAGDWRGELALEFRDALETFAVDPLGTERESHLSGRLTLEAEGFSAKVRRRNAPEGPDFEAKDFKLALSARNVPEAVFTPTDDVGLKRILRSDAPVEASIDELEFETEGRRAEVNGRASVLLSRRGDPPAFEADIDARLPDPVLRWLDVVVRGANRAARGLALSAYMVPEGNPASPDWTLDFSGSLEDGFTLNGRPVRESAR